MRVLHTSDWHVGKKLGQYDRLDEVAEVLAEVVEIADTQSVDLVVVSGDLFDRPSPPLDALKLVINTLLDLTDGGKRPVVAVAGNHDSGALFEVLAPLVETAGVHLVGEIKRPSEGGVVKVDTSAGPAAIACFPFLREGRVVDFMADKDSWYGTYADKIRELSQAYAEAAIAVADSDGVALLAAHFMVTGVSLGGHGIPRGERELHIGQAYAATEQAIPATLHYVAMGHIHAPQKVPASPVPAEYAGSLLQLDFGEAGEEKRVVVVDVAPGQPAKITSVPLIKGRPLVRATGTWDELVARDDLTDAYVDLVVMTDGPDPGLADRSRKAFPYLVKVEARYDRIEAERAIRAGVPWDVLFADYVTETQGVKLPEELLEAFREVHAAAIDEDV
jgi:exonuclease SbcD